MPGKGSFTTANKACYAFLVTKNAACLNAAKRTIEKTQKMVNERKAVLPKLDTQVKGNK